ncbi:MAG: LuxR C-terminal-related transcriptional regulator [Lachnospiraceae bacterium]
MPENKSRKVIQVCSMITLCFLWTSCGYLSWLYQLIKYVPKQADWLSEGIGYLFQAAGLFVFGMLFKHKIKKEENPTFLLRKPFILIMLCDYMLILASVLSMNLPSILVFGYLMNFVHGLVAAFYLTYLAFLIDWKHRSLTFGVGYGIASIASWLLSLPGENNFLCSPYVLIVYGILVTITISLLFLPLSNPEDKVSLAELSIEGIPYNGRQFPIRFVLIALLTIFFLSIVRCIGFFFPTTDLSKGIPLEFSRIFYALGLVLAGVLSDKNRKYGAIACILSLAFPFAMVALSGELKASIVLWILAYLFYGFYAVYRIVIFSDIASSGIQYTYLAGSGLMIGRIGEALGNILGIFLSQNHLIMVILSSIGYVICMLLFFSMYGTLYTGSTKRILSEDERLRKFIEQYGLSAREQHVVKLILSGNSNDEIAAKLYISENTVKFHIRNILKKTGCTNRMGIITLYDKI